MTAAAPAADDGLTDHERKRRAILDGAAEVFYRRGFVGGTTKEIAAQVGLSQPAIYHYVGSKDALLTEIARQVDRDLTGALDRALDGTADPGEQLRRIIEQLAEAVIANRTTYAVYWKELHALREDVREEVAADERAFVERVSGVVRRAQRAKALPAGLSTRVATEALLGMVGWISHWYRPGSDPGPDEVAATFTALLGLDPPAGPPARSSRTSPRSRRAG